MPMRRIQAVAAIPCGNRFISNDDCCPRSWRRVHRVYCSQGYTYIFQLGTLGSAAVPFTLAHRGCSELFPLAGCKNQFKPGDNMWLHYRLWIPPLPVFPVTVTKMQAGGPRPYFQFRALPGHPESFFGGRHITFSFYQDPPGNDYLKVRASAKPGSPLTSASKVRDVNKWVAKTKWKRFADNIVLTWLGNAGAIDPPHGVPA
jgi:hypothetical protein